MKVSQDVLNVLDQAETEGNRLVLTGQLDRKLYEQTNKVLEAAGGKWNRKAKAHVFDGDAAEAIEQVLLAGEITTHQDFGYFPTPEPVVRRLMELADVELGSSVLEPSAGTGAIAQYLAEVATVDCVELRQDYADKLLKTLGGARVIHVGDFLSLVPRPVYDRVVMNPPFSKQQDIKHVLHALKFLKPGGRLVSVMSAGVTFRQNRLAADFRQLIGDRGGTIEPNPEGAFKESGTLVCTVNVAIPN